MRMRYVRAIFSSYIRYSHYMSDFRNEMARFSTLLHLRDKRPEPQLAKDKELAII